MDREELLSKMSDDVKEYVDNVMDMYNAPFARQMGIEIVSPSSPWWTTPSPYTAT